jgi:hypothetical protein
MAKLGQPFPANGFVVKQGNSARLRGKRFL